MTELALPSTMLVLKAGRYVSNMSWSVTTAAKLSRPVSCEYAA